MDPVMSDQQDVLRDLHTVDVVQCELDAKDVSKDEVVVNRLCSEQLQTQDCSSQSPQLSPMNLSPPENVSEPQQSISTATTSNLAHPPDDSTLAPVSHFNKVTELPDILSHGVHTETVTAERWGIFQEENQGLNRNDVKGWARFTDSSSKLDTSSISSDTESVEDFWAITEEQREYYINQFKIMQPDVRGVLSGSVAKAYFEKSKLPVPELSKIWQLSDFNRDGALSLEEFCTAMHLVVLRRNDIELPDHLPQSLIPYGPLNSDEPFAADLPPGSTMKKLSPTLSPSSQWMSTSLQPIESPTSSSISSPGSKPTPVNFDYTPIIADAESKIVHPVPVRMSPEDHTSQVEGSAIISTFEEPGCIQNSDPLKSSLIQPFPGDPAAGGDSCNISTSTEENPAALHVSRSLSTTDNQQLPGANDGEDKCLPPPAVPPRALPKEEISSDNSSENEDVARTTQFDSLKCTTPPGPQEDHVDSDTSEIFTSSPAKGIDRQSSLVLKDFREFIRKQRLRNMALSRLHNELNQELQEVMEQRIALEIQLEHLRPFHSK